MKKIKPGPGQESVWDYPRPPRLEPCSKNVRVVVDDVVIADSSNSYRVLETSHPPVYYIPPEDVKLELLIPSSGSSFCEWKGVASYYDLQIDREINEQLEQRIIERVCWVYFTPSARFEQIARHLAFYPSKVDRCFVGDEVVRAQDGDFYGGWITPDIVGPFKGAPGTWGW